MARGWWTTSFFDRAKAQYQADQIARAVANNGSQQSVAEAAAYRQGWIDGTAAMERQLRDVGILPPVRQPD